MSSHNSLVATYSSHRLAENTVRNLHQAGFDMSKLSVIAKTHGDLQELEGVAVIDSLNALDLAQYACIPMEWIPDYKAELEVDRLLLVAHGTADEIAQAKTIIDATYPEGWDGKMECSIYYGCLD